MTAEILNEIVINDNVLPNLSLLHLHNDDRNNRRRY